ncbi:MAG TPA: DUF1003 domain-containing protein [Candidatus Elarobacter sp.]|jgi:uncharacterized membrane protein
MSVTDDLPPPPAYDVSDHPLIHDVNQEHTDTLSPIERVCKRIADGTGAPLALFLAIGIQVVWIGAGVVTKFDPFPFTFLLTVSNVLQLVLIFILAVGARQSSSHAELRAEHDHSAISRLLYHQEVQENILIEIASKIECDVSDLKAMVKQLAAQDSGP